MQHSAELTAELTVPILLVTVAPGPPLSEMTSLITSCVDEDAKCGSFAGTGECARNPEWMLTHCPLSCRVCGSEHAALLGPAIFGPSHLVGPLAASYLQPTRLGVRDGILHTSMLTGLIAAAQALGCVDDCAFTSARIRYGRYAAPDPDAPDPDAPDPGSTDPGSTDPGFTSTADGAEVERAAAGGAPAASRDGATGDGAEACATNEPDPADPTYEPDSAGKRRRLGSEGVGSEGVGSEGVGSEGVGSEGVGSEGVGSEGVGSEGVGSEGVGSIRRLPLRVNGSVGSADFGSSLRCLQLEGRLVAVGDGCEIPGDGTTHRGQVLLVRRGPLLVWAEGARGAADRGDRRANL